MPRLIIAMSLLLLTAQYTFAQDAIVDLLDISTQEEIENAIATYNNYLEEAVTEDGILQCLYEITRLKCYFPCTNYEELIEAVKRHKIKGMSGDVKFAAATVAKFLTYELSVGDAQGLLQIADRNQMFDIISRSVY